MTRRPMFLERRGYRRRRLMDAARVLPVIGAILLLMPLLWSLEPGRVMGTAGGGIYVFSVWGILVATAFVMARVLRPARGPGAGGDGGAEGAGDERGDIGPAEDAVSDLPVRDGAAEGGGGTAGSGLAGSGTGGGAGQ